MMLSDKQQGKIRQILNFIICFLMILAASVMRDGKYLGRSVSANDTSQDSSTVSVMREMGDNEYVINTSDIGADIVGYAGTVPLEIHVKDDVIVDVKALDNTETPDFFEAASSLLSAWKGKTLEEASDMQVDVVSGATFSSKAIIQNVRRGVGYAMSNEVSESVWSDFDFTLKNVAGLLVALMAAILPLFIKDKRYHLAQLTLNVIVLGFWCGAFISYSSLMSYMSNGVNVISLAVPCVLLVTAFVYPLFNKKTYYCANVCPFGSLQELVGRSVNRNIKIKSDVIKRLDLFRQYLWAALMLCMWTGLWFGWVDYEPFSAFVVTSASWVVIVLALIFVVLSAFIMRPYCRFVCPMGTLLKFSQSNK